MRRALLTLATALALPLGVARAQVISVTQAKDHVGQSVTVEGVVTDVGHSTGSETTFLNFGGKYPNHTFTAVIFRSAQAEFPDANGWMGKTLRITGRVQIYRDKPEIVLSRSSQVHVQP